jgi:thiol-disulfide isomerase/thioredoxin
MSKKKKKKESWKEKRRRAALKRERALEAERVRREREPKKRQKGWSRGKVFGVLFMISLCLVSYGVWYAMQPSTTPPPTGYTLTITSTAGGTTEPSGSINYQNGTLVTVQANPIIGYAFSYWKLDDVIMGSENSCLVLMDSDHALIAVFVEESPPSPEEPSLYTLTNTDFSEFRGKVVVLDFFATWCSPCIQQIPHLAEIHEKYNSSDVVIVSIGSSTDAVEDLEQFKEEHDMSWRVARDTVGAFDKYGVLYIPKLVILDQEGSISYEHEGVTSASDLANVIDSLLSS